MFPLLEGTDTEPKAAGKRGLGEPQLLAERFEIREWRVRDAIEEDYRISPTLLRAS